MMPSRAHSRVRRSQLFTSLLLPFALQGSLGGFEASSAVCLWAITSPLGALLFVGARQSVPWFVAFVGLVAISGAIEPALATGAPDIAHGVVVTLFVLNILGVATTAYAVLQYFVRARERALAELAREHHALELEQAKSERLLLNVLPPPVAESQGTGGDHRRRLSRRHRAFRRHRGLHTAHGVEKIKTIGDAYMVAAGVIGRAKFSYDLWGDTVNTASRMESHAQPGTIQVTERVYERLRHRYQLRHRGMIEIKGKAPMTSYQLIGPRADPAVPASRDPHERGYQRATTSPTAAAPTACWPTKRYGCSPSTAAPRCG